MSARRDVTILGAGIIALGGVILTYTKALHVNNPLIVGFTFLLVVLVAAAAARFWAAATLSVLALLGFNFFFLAPVGTFYLSDPQNWVALFVFLAVSLVASNLSTAARARAQEATDRQHELARLFDLSRDVLLITGSAEALSQLADVVARRFALDFAAICLPRPTDWSVYSAGTMDIRLDKEQLALALAGADRSLELDTRAATSRSHGTIETDGHAVRVVPLRVGTKAVGLLVAAGRPVEPGTLDALAGIAAIAVERVQLLDERKCAELAQQSEALKSALLASIAHDLRTPLTTIRVAASNLQASSLADSDRREQCDLILAEADRLHHVFQNILDMARIDAGAVSADRQWVHPSEIVEAARTLAEVALRPHRVDVEVGTDPAVYLDPRLTAAALAHVLNNAAQYSAAESPISVRVGASADECAISVRDHGPGISPGDLPHLFERFYRGTQSSQPVAGTGMGLSIARGMLAAEQGRIWAENCPDGGARFTLVVPAQRKMTASVAAMS